mmetsp:Transcript_17535/g.31716  ORF Transcript_17535/g.31716 Transcript_17535/m.31716 type:complete len:203 (-) Transcript_17535:162-770(-)
MQISGRDKNRRGGGSGDDGRAYGVRERLRRKAFECRRGVELSLHHGWQMARIPHRNSGICIGELSHVATPRGGFVEGRDAVSHRGGRYRCRGNVGRLAILAASSSQRRRQILWRRSIQNWDPTFRQKGTMERGGGGGRGDQNGRGICIRIGLWVGKLFAAGELCVYSRRRDEVFWRDDETRRSVMETTGTGRGELPSFPLKR